MKNCRLLVLLVSFLGAGVFSFAQNVIQNVKYLSVADAYEKIAETGLDSGPLYQRLGDYHYFRGNLVKARRWYDNLFDPKVVKEASGIDLEYYFRYAIVLRHLGEYAKSDIFMQKFRDMDTKIALNNQKGTFENYLAYQSNRVVIEEAVKINTAREEYAPAYKDGNTLLLASSKLYRKNNRHEGFLYPKTIRFKESLLDGEGRISKSAAMGYTSDLVESTPSFTKDGKTVFFTKKVCSSSGSTNCVLNIFKATISEDGKWENIESLAFNSTEYSTAHPAVTQDGRFLYFVSDKDNINSTDIYVQELGKGKLSDPQKVLGVNTSGTELFPYAAVDGDLYFSSNGHNGLGGYDIFVGKLVNYASVDRVYNLGGPINSLDDETSIAIDPSTKRGYFSSNRPVDKKVFIFFKQRKSQNMYHFREELPLVTDCNIDISGIVTDRKTSYPVEGAEVFLIDDKNNVLEKQTVMADGQFKFSSISCNDVYFVRVKARTYITSEKLVERSILIGTYTSIADISLDREGIEIPDSLLNTTADFTGVDIITGSDGVYGLEPIYFELDRDEISDRSKKMLGTVLQMMRTNKNQVIEIRSYADSRGSDRYNIGLSSRRALSTFMYLVNNGIDPLRISMKALGEQNPVNDCKDGVKCSEAEYSKNRRSEFTVLR